MLQAVHNLCKDVSGMQTKNRCYIEPQPEITSNLMCLWIKRQKTGLLRNVPDPNDIVLQHRSLYSISIGTVPLVILVTVQSTNGIGSTVE